MIALSVNSIMPNITRDLEGEEEWADALIQRYEEEAPRTGNHVSDYTLCLLQSVLSREYAPEWNLTTLFRFTLGKAFEKAFFNLIIPEATEELEVVKDDIEGHIDFGHNPYDFECKFTSSWEKDDPNEFFEGKSYWLEQGGAYAIMRDRRVSIFAVLHILPIPHLVRYKIEWDRRELQDNWDRILARKKYVDKQLKAGKLPDPTPLNWLCNNCQVKYVCPKWR